MMTDGNDDVDEMMKAAVSISVSVTHRGKKTELVMEGNTTVRQVKEAVAHQHNEQKEQEQKQEIEWSDLKLLFKGKKLENDGEDLYRILLNLPSTKTAVSKSKKVPTYKMVATGISKTESNQMNESSKERISHNDRLVRDDISDQGIRRQQQRQRLGRHMMSNANQRDRQNQQQQREYGFGGIKTLPNLQDEDRARQILESLANDPGVLACMEKHRWNVGTLSEMYPEGKVGESPVCVMGLNRNRGQEILLRLRTDDLKGFRKILSIRQVLYHELAHNVHGEHDGKFFQLMRQIERECNEYNAKHGTLASPSYARTTETGGTSHLYEGGTYRLGGGGGAGGEGADGGVVATTTTSARELAAMAAMKRMTMTNEEAEEIQLNCGCGGDGGGAGLKNDLFLPESEKNDAKHDDDDDRDKKDRRNQEDDDKMDVS